MCKRGEEEEEIDRLYEQYGKPLEAEHWGEYLAVSDNGVTRLAPTLDELMERLEKEPDGNGTIFKVGEIAVFRI
jgi:hypothetical protein